MEYKSFPSFTKEIKERTVTGLAAVFGNIDDGNDRILPGAFSKTIKENRRRFKHLWMHNPFILPTATILDVREVGKSELPGEVLEEYPEAIGGLEVSREYLDTQNGNETLEALQKGAINEMSFGYDPIKSLPDKDNKRVRNLTELRLWDTSDVTWGMNGATVGAKSFTDTELSLASELIESYIKAGRVLSESNLTRLKNALAVLNEILNAAEPSISEEEMKSLTEQTLKKLAQAQVEFEIYQRSLSYV